MSEYREYTADYLTYEALQKLVLENEAKIKALSSPLNEATQVVPGDALSVPIERRGSYMLCGGSSVISNLEGNSEFHLLVFFQVRGSSKQQVLHQWLSSSSLRTEIVDFTDDHMSVANSDSQNNTFVIHTS